MANINFRGSKRGIKMRKRPLFKKKKKFFNSRKKYSSKYLKRNVYQQKRMQRNNKDISSVIIRNAIMIIAGILIILLIYFLFFSNYFTVKEINLVDAQEVSEDQIRESFNEFKQKRRFLIFPAENIFLMDEERLRRIILENNFYLEDLDIEKKLIDVIKVKVKEKVISAAWVSGSNLYYIDNYGNICCDASIDGIVERELPAIYDLENKEINPNDEVVTQNFIGFLKELNDKFPEQINVSVKKYWVPSILSREVHLETDDGFRVYMSVDRSVESQLNDFNIVIQEQLKNNLSYVEYIDLRVENWVYYK